MITDAPGDVHLSPDCGADAQAPRRRDRGHSPDRGGKMSAEQPEGRQQGHLRAHLGEAVHQEVVPAQPALHGADGALGHRQQHRLPWREALLVAPTTSAPGLRLLGYAGGFALAGWAQLQRLRAAVLRHGARGHRLSLGAGQSGRGQMAHSITHTLLMQRRRILAQSLQRWSQQADWVNAPRVEGDGEKAGRPEPGRPAGWWRWARAAPAVSGSPCR